MKSKGKQSEGSTFNSRSPRERARSFPLSRASSFSKNTKKKKKTAKGRKITDERGNKN